MTKLADVFKDEIRRLARKEIKAHATLTSKTIARHRKDIAELKRQNSALIRRLGLLESRKESSSGDDPDRPIRFSARSVKSQRKRLGMSASAYGRLVGVSGMTIYNWEQGKSRPKESQLAALVAVRSIGKRDAKARLDQIDNSQAQSARAKSKAASKR